MKLSLIASLLAFSTIAMAQSHRDRTAIDHLQGIPLQVDARETEVYEVHYPNYRIGGGTPPRREIRDCLLVDIGSTDTPVTLSARRRLAQALEVRDGFHQHSLLEPRVQGQNVVFPLKTGSAYMTFLSVKAAGEKTLRESIIEVNKNFAFVPVQLLYVRGCRL